MDGYKIRSCTGFGAVLLFALGQPVSAYAICQDIRICWTRPTPHCEIYHNVCKEVPPQTAEATGQNKYSIEVKDLSWEELQRTFDLLGFDKSRMEVPK